MGNHLSILFRTLFEAWNADAASDDVDRLAAELTSQVAREVYQHTTGIPSGHKLRYCSLLLVETDQVSRYQGLNLFLQTYGLRLGLKVLRSGRGCIPRGFPAVILGIALIPRQQKASGLRAKAQAFKRACSKFGLGRYLYDLPVPWVEYDAEKKRLLEVLSALELFQPP